MTRFLRRLSVRQRILGGFVLLILLTAASLPVIIFDHNISNAQLRQVIDVDTQVNRLLLNAAVRVAASRANLLRYLRDTVPSPYEAADDVQRALAALLEVQDLLNDPGQQQYVHQLSENLAQYARLIEAIQEARVTGDTAQVTTLEFQSQRLGNDIGTQIERVVTQSQEQVELAKDDFIRASQQRLFLIIVVMLGALIISGGLGLVVERSITHPVAELRAGAEAFAHGDLQAKIPIYGTDELSLLAETFNHMAMDLSVSYTDLEQRVNARTQDLERRSTYLQAAAEVSRAATAILDAEKLIARSVDIIRERFRLYYVGLFLVDKGSEWAVLRAGTGEAGKIMLARGHRIKVGEGMVGWSVANAQPRIALQAESDAVRKVTVELPDTRSEAALPLRSRGRVIGALTVQDDEFDAFDESAVAVLLLMADQLAVAIDNAQLYAESQATLEALRSAYGETTREGWDLVARQQWGFVSTADGVLAPIERGAWSPDMVRAARAGTQVQIDPLNLAVPIKYRGAVIGVVQLHKPEERGAWTSRELTLVNVLLDRLAVTLESARLYEDTQRRAVNERLLATATGRIRQTLDMDTVLRTAVQELREMLDLAQAEVYLGVEVSSAPPRD